MEGQYAEQVHLGSLLIARSNLWLWDLFGSGREVSTQPPSPHLWSQTPEEAAGLEVLPGAFVTWLGSTPGEKVLRFTQCWPPEGQLGGRTKEPQVWGEARESTRPTSERRGPGI